MRVAILSDSTAYIPKKLREKYNIYIIPLSVVFGTDAYREEFDITTEAFYEKVEQSEDLPTTSQPSVGTFTEMYTQLAKDYDAVISIHISSNLSGTSQAAESAKEMVDDLDVYIFDSKYSAMGQGFFAIKAAELAAEGKSPEAIMDYLEYMRGNIRAYFMVDSLHHLQRGGRIGGAEALVGSLLKVKPILHILDGTITAFEKIRTRKKALNRIVSMLEEDADKGNVERVVFIHGNDEHSALELEADFKQKYPEIETIISYFGPVVGTHLGEGALGIAWYKK